MDSKKLEQQQVDINFESHPPIPEDLNGVATLLKQTLLQFVDCHSLAQYLIEQKDLTQVIAQEDTQDEEGTETDEDDEDEPDDDIYGVTSVIDLPLDQDENDEKAAWETRKQLMKFVQDKCPQLKTMLDGAKEKGDKIKIGLIVNERYINLPPQLALPTLKTLTSVINDLGYTHLVFISKIHLRSRSPNTKLPSKKSKISKNTQHQAEPILFVNSEEEVIFEQSDCHNDLDVSAHCDENATWSFSSDIKYIPHRRILLLSYQNWPKTLQCLEKELN